MVETNTNSATEPQKSGHLYVPGLQPNDAVAARMPPHADPEPLGPLLLVDDETSSCIRLQRLLTAKGFDVTSVHSARAALNAATGTQFAYAVLELRLGRDSGLELIKELRKLHAPMRIVVVTGFDSFASVTLALKAGAADYLPKPVNEGELINALLDGRSTMLPPVPNTPLGLERTYWEYIQRIWEQCDRNVSETARLLGMHRRTLQRIMGKRAPRPRRQPMD